MRSLRLATLILLAAASNASATVRPVARPDRGAGRTASRMVMLPAGQYRPLYAARGAAQLRVAAFALDRDLVTTGEFLAFVERHPEWRRDRVRRVYADASYLADWPSATDAGSSDARRLPVTQVSWFAARAYCAAAGKRLPTVDEWEYAAAASEHARDARGDAGFRARLLALYAGVGRRTGADARGFANAYGVRAMHGVVWEWTLDFNSVVLDDDSRATGSGADARDRHLYCASAALGATDPADYPAFLRHAVRAGLGARSSTSAVGFRCAASTVVS
jgi:formylglycine-generating enzyme required for sulfatase activity